MSAEPTPAIGSRFRPGVQDVPLEWRKALAELIVLVAPVAGLATGAVLLWNRAVTWLDVGIMVFMYVAVGLGTTVGFHRHLTHRAFATYRPVSYLLAALGSMSMQGSVIDWVADHRVHHACADRAGDPHSPHGPDSTLRSLWHAHAGWLFRHQGRADHACHAADLIEDRGMRLIDRAFLGLVGLSLAVPFGLGWAASGSLWGGVTGAIWGGLVRMFLFHHVVFSVNSLGHYVGRRRFVTGDRSTNMSWLALPSLGESWHHNHHAFPRSAMHGLCWYELDLSGLVIRALARVGLAWNVVLIPPERQRQKLVAR